MPLNGASPRPKPSRGGRGVFDADERSAALGHNRRHAILSGISVIASRLSAARRFRPACEHMPHRPGLLRPSGLAMTAFRYETYSRIAKKMVIASRACGEAIQARQEVCAASPWIASAKRPRNDGFQIRNVLTHRKKRSLRAALAATQSRPARKSVPHRPGLLRPSGLAMTAFRYETYSRIATKWSLRAALAATQSRPARKSVPHRPAFLRPSGLAMTAFRYETYSRIAKKRSLRAAFAATQSRPARKSEPHGPGLLRPSGLAMTVFRYETY